jgi:hypothetical protein
MYGARGSSMIRNVLCSLFIAMLVLGFRLRISRLLIWFFHEARKGSLSNWIPHESNAWPFESSRVAVEASCAELH